MIDIENIEKKIIKKKIFLRNKSQNYKNNFLNIQKYIEKEILNIEELKNNNLDIIPEINFNDLETHSENFITEVKKRGCVVIRDVFEDSMMKKMNTELEDYMKKTIIMKIKRRKQILIIILVILNQASLRYLAYIGQKLR